MNCLSAEDSIAILKQKIYDIAEHANQEYKANGYNRSYDYVFNILHSDAHVI